MILRSREWEFTVAHELEDAKMTATAFDSAPVFIRLIVVPHTFLRYLFASLMNRVICLIPVVCLTIDSANAVGFRTKSLALIADANSNFTFAFHRAELVGAFFNGVFLLALALSIFLQSIERFVHIEPVESPVMVLIVGAVGLTLNVTSMIVVHDHGGHGHGDDAIALSIRETTDHASHNHSLDPPTQAPQHNLNLIGVLIHLCGDAMNNVAVMISALIIWKLHAPERYYADPAVSLAISLIIFGSAIPTTMKSSRILLEAVPLYLDLEKVKDDLLSVPDVLSVHDLHVWHLSQSVILASLHVCVPFGATLEQWEKTEQCLQHCFSAYGISHVTISPEMYRDSQVRSDRTSGTSRCKSHSQDDFGCAVHDVRRRKFGV
ncbi:hypothetical protein L208DRAFT_1420809 [Tricholoma matsutake]|nr:hypothetical protein L208DRAFT_1420809 [Tricholoma matsutake 945]